LTEIESIVAGTTTLDREWAMPCLILNTITKYRKRSIQSYNILVKVRNSNKDVLKFFLIIVNINKDENKSLISNQFSLKNDSPPHHFLENYFAEVKIKKLQTITNHF
jgi:hypothetical protein